MIEVLVTIVVLAIGLLGLLGLQAKLQLSEMESYQRSQALVLLTDMTNRLSTNRANATSYAALATIDSPLGTDRNCAAIGNATQHQRDAAEWCDALQGAGETQDGSRVGAMIGGRGCVEDLGGNDFRITVAWQGMAPVSAPPVSIGCGLGDYGSGTTCASDRCRRVVSTVVRIAKLD